MAKTPEAFHFHGAGRVRDPWATERSEQRERKSKDLGQLLRSLARSVAGEGKRRGGCGVFQPPRRAGGARELASPGGSIFSVNFLLSPPADHRGSGSPAPPGAATIR